MNQFRPVWTHKTIVTLSLDRHKSLFSEWHDHTMALTQISAISQMI
jgi:hypothetical protein